MTIAFIRRASGVFATNIFSVILATAAGILLARRLGPEQRGYFGLIVMAVQLTHSLGHFGMGSAIAFYTGKKAYPRGEILTFLVTCSLLFGSVLGGAFFLVYPHIPRIWEEIDPIVMAIGLLATPFMFFHNFLMRFLFGMLKVSQSNMTNIFRTLSYLVLVTILLWIMNGGTRDATICFTASFIIASILGFALFTKDIRLSKWVKPSLIRPFFKYGSQVYVFMLLNFLNHRLNVYLIKHFLTYSDVAFYQIASSIIEHLLLMPNAFVAILYPTLLSMEKDTVRYTAKICRNNLFIMLCAALLLLVAGKPMIVLAYGRDYLPSTYALYSLLVGLVMLPIATIIWVNFAAKQQMGVGILSSALGLTLNVGANFYLIPRYGIVGAGAATSLSYTLVAMILVLTFMHRSKVTLRELFLINREDVDTFREKARKGWDRLRDRRKGQDGPTSPTS